MIICDHFPEGIFPSFSVLCERSVGLATVCGESPRGLRKSIEEVRILPQVFYLLKTVRMIEYMRFHNLKEVCFCGW